MNAKTVTLITACKIFTYLFVTETHYFDDKIEIVFDNGNQSIVLFIDDYDEIRIRKVNYGNETL